MLADITSQLAPLFEQMDWCDDEIEEARRRHPYDADLLYHAFLLLRPTDELMRTEFVYRSHCRELLERLVEGNADLTQWPTNAELALHCCHASQQAPLTTAATTVYMRAWKAAFPGRTELMDGSVHYEHVAGGRADSLASTMRRRLRQEWRVLGEVECPGRHHGEPAPQCRFYRPKQLALPAFEGAS
jgi:hypothetical protein